ncbi:MAG: c-type cytochrome [Ignavibacteriae bacterium]|nr:c-type cytochrome [Ignavibacteriota bacterium]MCB9215639.1 c-type cytochrome [Ignavibacteria bacterium]
MNTIFNNYQPSIFLTVLTLASALFYTGCELLDPNPGPSPVTAGSNGGNNNGTITPPTDTIPPSLDRGVNLYAQYCARCHGDDASGGTVWPGSIQGKIGIHTIVRDGRRGMPNFPGLTDSEIESIELFLNSFNIDNSTKSGKELFEFYCSSCHGSDATGTNIFSGSIQSYSPIHTIVQNGKGEMDPIAIPDSLIDKIQEYLLGFNVDFKSLSGREYYDRVCASCHGLEGEGSTRGPEIRNPVAGFATYVIRNGRPGEPWYTREMPRYDTDSLSNTQLNEIIAWLRNAVKPTDAGSLFNRFCANCHGTDARGGPVGESIRSKTGEFLEKVREGEGGTNYSRRTKYMPSWSTSELTNDEVSKMAAYVRSLP